jgi:hypothetical protein
MASAEIEKMIQNDATWFEELVLARLTADSGFVTRYANVLCHTTGPDGKPEPCMDFTTPQLQGLFLAVQLYLGITQGLPAAGLSSDMMTRCVQSIAEQGRYVMAGDVAEIMILFDAVRRKEWRPATVVIDEHVGFWLNMQRYRHITAQAKQQQTRPDEVVGRLVAESRRIQTQKDEGFYRGGHGLSTHVERAPVICTRIASLDKACGGGLEKKQSTLVIAASGVGKTVLAMQLACNLAIHGGRKGMVISTEEDHRALEKRLVSNYCQVPYSTVLDIPSSPDGGFMWRRLPDHTHEGYHKLMELMYKNLVFFDWPKGQGRDITNGLQDDYARAADMLGGMEWCELDWIGSAIAENETDPGKLTLRYQNAADTFVTQNDLYDVAGVAFAQAHPDRGYKTSRVGQSCLSTCKSMGRKMVNIWGLSGLRDTDDNTGEGARPTYQEKQFIYVDKARFGEGGLIPLRRQTAFQRFADFQNSSIQAPPLRP